jgi:hypothetical protein
MKLVILLYAMLFLLPNNNALQCMYYGEGILILPLYTFNLTGIKQTVNNLVIFKEHYKCFISITFEPGLRNLTIIFEDIGLFTLIVNVDMFIVTRISWEMNNSSIENSIGFSCNKEDLCDQQFMFDYLEWLFNVEYNHLGSTVRPLLLTGNNQKGKQNKPRILF